MSKHHLQTKKTSNSMSAATIECRISAYSVKSCLLIRATLGRTVHGEHIFTHEKCRRLFTATLHLQVLKPPQIPGSVITVYLFGFKS